MSLASQKADEREQVEMVEALQKKDIAAAKTLLANSVRRSQQ